MSVSDYITVVIVIVISVALGFIFRKKEKNQDFDEMQAVMRGRGYKGAYLITLFLLLGYLFLKDTNVFDHFDTGFLVFLIIMIGITYFICFCVIKDAYFYVRQDGRKYKMLVLAAAVFSGILALIEVITGTIVIDGMVSFESGAFVVCFICFLIVTITFVIKRRMDEES